MTQDLQRWADLSRVSLKKKCHSSEKKHSDDAASLQLILKHIVTAQNPGFYLSHAVARCNVEQQTAREPGD